MNKTVACIIARTASRRLPKKVLRKINEKTLIEYLIEKVKKTTKVDEIYLCTSVDLDDKILIEIAEQNGIKAYAGSRDVVIDRMLDVAKLENADNLIRITGDNVFTDEIFMDKMIELHVKNHADYSRITSLPIGVTGELFSVNGLKSMYENLDPKQTEYLTYYVFFAENNLRKLILYPPEQFKHPYLSLTVDTPEDLERTIFIMNNIKGTNIYLDDILNLHESNNIPYFNIDKNTLIKFPNNQLKKYGEYMKELEEKYKNCIRIELEEDFYEQSKIK